MIFTPHAAASAADMRDALAPDVRAQAERYAAHLHTLEKRDRRLDGDLVEEKDHGQNT